MKISIHPFSNGSAYGWNKLKSLFDFFFPIALDYRKDDNVYHFIRREAATDALLENGKLIVKRDFYTFRAFFWHYWYTLLVNPLRNWKKNAQKWAVELGLDPILATQLGAIAFDAASDGTSTTNSITVSHTCTGSNRQLVSNVRDNTTTADNVNTVQYAGVAMTKINSIANPTPNRRAYIFDKSAPTSGANNITATITTAGSVRFLSYSYSGVTQTGQPDTNNTASLTGTSTGVAMTSSDANGWAIVCYMNAEADHNSNTNIVYRSGSGGTEAGDTNGVIGSTASVTYTFGYAVSVNNAICGAVYIPAAAAQVGWKSLLGVGQG